MIALAIAASLRAASLDPTEEVFRISLIANYALLGRTAEAEASLREWQDGDREPFAALNADPRVAEFLRGPLDRAASDALVERIRQGWAADGHGLWAVERSENGAFIGFVGLAAHSFEAAFTPTSTLIPGPSAPVLQSTICE